MQYVTRAERTTHTVQANGQMSLQSRVTGASQSYGSWWGYAGKEQDLWLTRSGPHLQKRLKVCAMNMAYCTRSVPRPFCFHFAFFSPPDRYTFWNYKMVDKSSHQVSHHKIILNFVFPPPLNTKNKCHITLLY